MGKHKKGKSGNKGKDKKPLTENLAKEIKDIDKNANSDSDSDSNGNGNTNGNTDSDKTKVKRVVRNYANGIIGDSGHELKLFVGFHPAELQEIMDKHDKVSGDWKNKEFKDWIANQLDFTPIKTQRIAVGKELREMGIGNSKDLLQALKSNPELVKQIKDSV